jgi:O-methyltransferase
MEVSSVAPQAKPLVSAEHRFSLRSLSFLRPALLATQSLARRAGFELIYTTVKGIKDAELYKPMFEPWLGAQWRSILRAEDPRSVVSLERKYVLYSQARQALRDAEGAVAECGVYRGGTAIILAELAASFERETYLFDTFEGMPETDASKDLHVKGDFVDTSLASVSEYLSSCRNVVFRPGYVPATFAGLEEQRFAFVHIDLDIFQSVKDAVSFFYPRLAPGGVIVFDDYGFPSCPGARAAVDEYFSAHAEEPFVLRTGQCVVRKGLH